MKTSFPGTDEARAAEDLLASLDGKAGGGSGSGKVPPPPATFKKSDGEHFYVLVVPNEGNDINLIRTAISDFNRSFFPSVTLEVTSSFLDAERQVVLMSPLPDKATALQYHQLFTGNQDVLNGINNVGFESFAITTDNYSALYKSKDVLDYMAFFQQNYLDRQ